MATKKELEERIERMEEVFDLQQKQLHVLAKQIEKQHQGTMDILDMLEAAKKQYDDEKVESPTGVASCHQCGNPIHACACVITIPARKEG